MWRGTNPGTGIRRITSYTRKWQQSARKWRAWQDSNPQPLGPKPSTLSIELQAHWQPFGCSLSPGGGRGDDHSVAALLGRATGFEPVISCATDRRLDHSATLATHTPMLTNTLPRYKRIAPGLPGPSGRPKERRIETEVNTRLQYLDITT